MNCYACQFRLPSRAISIAVAAIVLSCASDASAGADVSRLRLRASAIVEYTPVTLGDVLAFTDADAELIAKITDKPVFASSRDASRTTVTHDDVAQRLTELEVNPASVLIEGAASCRVLVQPPVTAPHSAVPAGEAKSAESSHSSRAAAAPAIERNVVDGATLADRIRDLINREMAALGGTGEIEFERAGREYLDLTAPLEFDIRPATTDKIGIREFRVTVKRDGKVERSAAVVARVRLVRDAVVAKRPLSIGNLVREGDVGLEPQVFDNVSELGLASIEQAVGRQATKFVPAGEMLNADGLKAVDLVQRSKPITVLNGDGGVQMKLAGIALDAGAYGDTIRVRLGEGRNARQQVQAVVIGVNTVRLGEVKQ